MTDNENGKGSEIQPEQVAELREWLDSQLKDMKEGTEILRSFLDFRRESQAEADEDISVEEVEEEPRDPALEEAARLQAEEQEEFLEQMFAATGGDPNALDMELTEKEKRQREILKRAQAKRVAELEAKDQANRESLERFAEDLLEDQLKRDGGQTKKRLVDAAAHHEQLARELGPEIERGVQERREVMAKLEEERIKKERRDARATYRF